MEMLGRTAPWWNFYHPPRRTLVIACESEEALLLRMGLQVCGRQVYTTALGGIPDRPSASRSVGYGAERSTLLVLRCARRYGSFDGTIRTYPGPCPWKYHLLKQRRV